MVKAGGILTIIAGCVGIGAGAWLTLIALPMGMGGAIAGGMAGGMVGPALGGLLAGLAGFLGMIGTGAIGLGVVALIGGIFTLRRRLWGLALTGAILAIPIMLPLGILATIFVSKRRKEFA